MKKGLFILSLIQSFCMNAQMETVVTGNGKKVQIDTTPNWLLNGNTNTSENSLGTKNAFDLPFLGEDSEVMRVTTDGKVLINTKTSLTGSSNVKMQVKGNMLIQDGTQGAGKVLTSDSNGVASWKTSAVSTEIYRFTIPHPAVINLPVEGVYQKTGSDFYIPVTGIYRIFSDFNLPPGYMIRVSNTGNSNWNILHYSQSADRFYENTLVYLEKGFNAIWIYNDDGKNITQGGPYWTFIVEGPVN